MDDTVGSEVTISEKSSVQLDSLTNHVEFESKVVVCTDRLRTTSDYEDIQNRQTRFM